MHIPKTGGTTLREIVRANYQENEYVEIYENQLSLTAPNPEFIEKMHDRRDRLRAVFGHFGFGVHRFLDVSNPQYVTMLRDPIQRAISFFGHVAREPRSRYYDAIQHGMTLKELVLSHWAPELNNHAIRMLLGEPHWRIARWPPNPHDPPQAIDQLLDPCHLDRALQIVENNFIFVGTMERFVDSISLLAQAARWPTRNLTEIPPRNARPDPAPPVDDKTLQVLTRYNALDIELHRRFNDHPLARIG